MVDINTICTAEPFDELFPIDNRTLKAVRESMLAGGYDPAEPIIVWPRAGNDGDGSEVELVCVDGNTRLMAARDVGIQDVPVIEKDFADENKAVEYAIHRQRDRRNLTDAELLACLTWMDKRKTMSEAGTEGGRGNIKIASNEASFNKSAEKTAEALGVSRAKVERARTVMDHGTPEIKQAIEAGDMSINKAYETVQSQRKEAKKSTKEPTKEPTKEHTSKPSAQPTKPPVNKETIIDPEFKCAFDDFYREIQRIRLEKWKLTSKEAALKMINIAKDLVELP